MMDTRDGGRDAYAAQESRDFAAEMESRVDGRIITYSDNGEVWDRKITAAARRMEREIAKADAQEAERIRWCNIGQPDTWQDDEGITCSTCVMCRKEIYQAEVPNGRTVWFHSQSGSPACRIDFSWMGLETDGNWADGR